jgi:hypothetical protein
MKSSKNNITKIALFLILVGILAIFYFIRFYKTTYGIFISKNADAILMVDIKNIENHLTYTFLKNPSNWKTTSTKNTFRFSDFGIEKTDYLPLFHLENQPLTQWLLATRIVDKTDFELSIRKYKFNKIVFKNGITYYSSMTMKISIVKQNNQILVCNCTKTQMPITLKTAEDLFIKKEYLSFDRYEKTINTANALTFWIKKNKLLEKDGIINIYLNESEIVANGELEFKSKYRKESQFSLSPNAVLSLGLNFEMIRDQEFITENSEKINKIIGFNLDSILIHNPTKTEFILNQIIEKKDSAISYELDDDFNTIQKVIVHKRREPSFLFSMQTENTSKVFDILKKQNAIDHKNIFVNFPLAQTKTAIQNNTLLLQANPLKKINPETYLSKIAYIQIHFDKIQEPEWRLLISKYNNMKALKSFESMGLELTLENSKTNLNGFMKIKKDLNWITVLNK